MLYVRRHLFPWFLHHTEICNAPITVINEHKRFIDKNKIHKKRL